MRVSLDPAGLRHRDHRGGRCPESSRAGCAVGCRHPKGDRVGISSHSFIYLKLLKYLINNLILNIWIRIGPIIAGRKQPRVFGDRPPAHRSRTPGGVSGEVVEADPQHDVDRQQHQALDPARAAVVE